MMLSKWQKLVLIVKDRRDNLLIIIIIELYYYRIDSTSYSNNDAFIMAETCFNS